MIDIVKIHDSSYSDIIQYLSNFTEQEISRSIRELISEMFRKGIKLDENTRYFGKKKFDDLFEYYLSVIKKFYVENELKDILNFIFTEIYNCECCNVEKNFTVLIENFKDFILELELNLFFGVKVEMQRIENHNGNTCGFSWYSYKELDNEFLEEGFREVSKTYFVSKEIN